MGIKQIGTYCAVLATWAQLAIAVTKYYFGYVWGHALRHLLVLQHLCVLAVANVAQPISPPDLREKLRRPVNSNYKGFLDIRPSLNTMYV